MASQATVLADWTALCTTDSDALLTDLVPVLQTLGNTYISFRMLPDADKPLIQQVNPSKLSLVRELCMEVGNMIENDLKAIRYIPPEPVVPE